MALVRRFPRDSRLPVAFLTHRNPASNRSVLLAISPRQLAPLLFLLQARTATGYTGARKTNNLWKQPALAIGASQSSRQEGPNDDSRRNQKTKKSKKSRESKQERVSHQGGNRPHSEPRGAERSSEEVRLSKTLSWILRHGAAFEGLAMREDGFVYVSDILKLKQLQKLGLTHERLKGVVKADPKQRFSLVREQADGPRLKYTAIEGNRDEKDVWLVRASQGHSIRALKIEFKPILHVSDIPSGIAVHGTTRAAWDIIEKEGLSKMNRNHIHLAQGVGENNIISGMRRSSQVLIFINIPKALDAGVKFYLSDNGVVLTEGDEHGNLNTEFFDRVEDAKTRKVIEGWEGSGEVLNEAVVLGGDGVIIDK